MMASHKMHICPDCNKPQTTEGLAINPFNRLQRNKVDNLHAHKDDETIASERDAFSDQELIQMVTKKIQILVDESNKPEPSQSGANNTRNMIMKDIDSWINLHIVLKKVKNKKASQAAKQKQ
jgi:hypothetical protein